MKKTVYLAISLMAGVENVGAQSARDPLKDATIHIVTAHECRKVTGDKSRETKATDQSKARLIRAGYSESEADIAIRKIAEALSEKPTKMTPQLCEMILTKWEKAD